MIERKKPNVFILDDVPLFRKAINDVLAASDEFTVLGATGDEQVGLSLATLQPDIALVNLESTAFDPIGVLDEIKRRSPACRIVMLMNSAQSATTLLKAIQHEANGYLLRSIEIDEFLAQMRNVAAGGMAASEKITSALADQLRSTSTSGVMDQNVTQLLTRREYQILRCLASGLVNTEIAEALRISEGTIKVHVKHLLKKLRVRSRLEAAIWGAERGHRLSPKEMRDGMQ